MIRQKCSIPGCPGSKNEIVRTYGFPKNPHLAGIWAGFCKVGLEKLRNARICDRHFSQKQKKVCIGKYSQVPTEPEYLGQKRPASISCWHHGFTIVITSYIVVGTV